MTRVTFCLFPMALLCLTGVLPIVQRSSSTASCELEQNESLNATEKENIVGKVGFIQDTNGTVDIDINISGFDIPDNMQLHGIHIHEKAGSGSACGTARAHFNPEDQNHGDPKADVRHVGDLGNIEEDGNGDIITTLKDNQIKLAGADNNIIGKVLVIHANRDDLGLGEDEESLKTGNSGPFLACCVIKTSDANGTASPTAISPLQFLILQLVSYTMIYKKTICLF